MARSKASLATKNLKHKLLGHAESAISAVNMIELNGELSAEHCRHMENMALDLIGALREYQRNFNPLFTQGQKS